MSTEVTTAFVQQYRATVIHLAQQKMARLMGTAMIKDDVTGKSAFFDRLGLNEMIDAVSRHDDTPQIDTPHSRRMVTMTTSRWADLIDKADNIRILLEPTSNYVRAASSGVGRRQDDHIITALLGTSKAGETGATDVVLPAGQKIAVTIGGGGDVGLNLDKILRAKELLDAAEVDPDGRVFLLSSRQLNRDLLALEKITSADYNAIRALVRGDLDTFLGFQFIRTQRLGTDANSDRQCIAYGKGAVGLAIGRMQTFRVGERADKHYATQVFVEMDMGATRVEDEQVVEIACDET